MLREKLRSGRKDGLMFSGGDGSGALHWQREPDEQGWYTCPKATKKAQY